MAYRPTVAEIDLDALRANIKAIRQHVGDSRVVMAVVKSDAYGHGMIQIARAAVQAGAGALGVATSDEGLRLRETPGFSDIPVLVMAPTLPCEAEAMQRANLAFSVGTLPLLRHHLEVARQLGRPARIHLQLETGIGRDGVPWDGDDALDVISRAPECLEAVWAHYSVADGLTEDEIVYTRMQTERLLSFAKRARAAGLRFQLHAANSGAVLRHPETWFDMVRPGIMIYGVDPAGTLNPPVPLRPVMHLKSALAVVRDMKEGDPISYGRSYICPGPRRIATVPIGYGDGYARQFSNIHHVLVRGMKAPIRGRVCMDQIMVDVTDIHGACEGDEVVLYGTQSGERIWLEEAAEIAGTIPYDLTCRITNRVPRLYKGEV